MSVRGRVRDRVGDMVGDRVRDRVGVEVGTTAMPELPGEARGQAGKHNGAGWNLRTRPPGQGQGASMVQACAPWLGHVHRGEGLHIRDRSLYQG